MNAVQTLPGWKITEDKLFDPKWDEKPATGTADGSEDGLTIPFRLYDDDGELYYVGLCNEESYLAGDDHPDEGTLYKAWKWGEWFAGCTDLRLRLSDLEQIHGSDSKTYEIFRDKIARPDGWCSIFG